MYQKPLIINLFLLILSISICISGCISADVLHLDNSQRTKKTSSEVQVLFDEPKQEYIAIAVIELAGGAVHSLDDMRNRMAEEAAKLGGDAVIIDFGKEYSGSLYSRSASVPVYEKKRKEKSLYLMQSWGRRKSLTPPAVRNNGHFLNNCRA